MTGLRIMAGAWKGRKLIAPAGEQTRPTNARARQAVFDILAHAPWCNLRGALVLDVFAGTGAYGLEALSRGAAQAGFIEKAPAALAALRANIDACKTPAARVMKADALHPPVGEKQDLVFLDPPYGQGLVLPALAALQQAGWVGDGTIIIAELGPDDVLTIEAPLVSRRHGKAQLEIWRYDAARAALKIA